MVAYVQEFADFLGAQPPFDALTAGDLERLARRVEVEYFAAGTVIVQAGAAPLDHLYVVRTGAVEILDRSRVVDLLGPGDTFGHISVLTGLAPALSVRAAEDSLCYRLPDPRTVVADPSPLRFSHFGTMIARDRLTRAGLLAGPQTPVTRHMRPIVWCEASARVRDVAQAIGQADQSCALVRTVREIGIVTDHDFRSRVATAEVGVEAPVATIMTTPASSVPASATVATAFVQMVKAGVHHLVVTDDGGRPAGVLRAMDLASVEVRDPLLIRSAIDAAASIDALREACQLLAPTLVELHDGGVPAGHIGALQAALVDAALGRLLALSGQDGAAPARSWLVLGSMARHEPAPGSDVDTGIVWADDTGSDSADPDSADPAETIRRSARGVLDDMEKCGLQRCPDGANADNPLFSRSRSGWIAAARSWITEPTRDGALLLSSIIADSRPITELTVGRVVTDTIRETTRGTDFLDALLQLSVADRPPAGFIRDFVVEHSGEHRGSLDLKRGGLRPISALARWLAIAIGDVRGTTPERLHRAAAAGLLTDDEAQTLAGAFADVYELLLRQEITALREGRRPSRWVAPRSLDNLTRRHLRDSFHAIAAVQAELVGAWKTRLAAL
ncbi:MAG TPA: putative nucleotidyltransferase substrate binding domain-containing protein [Streptosporangiaceae bacterium]|jgi:CBS domain-containing protein